MHQESAKFLNLKDLLMFFTKGHLAVAFCASAVRAIQRTGTLKSFPMLLCTEGAIAFFVFDDS